MSACMCDFEETCNGKGYLECTGCGGDFCICAACFGHGEEECDGCGDCDGITIDDFDDEEECA